MGNTFAKGSPPINSELAAGKLFVSDKPVKLDPFPQYRRKQTRVERPARDVLYVVTDAPWNADGQRSGRRHTGRPKSARAGRQRRRRHRVLSRGQLYPSATRSPCRAGSNCEASYDVPHHTVGGGSMLHDLSWNQPKPHRGGPRPGRAGGLSFNYPDQAAGGLKQYPFLIPGRGNDLYISMSTAAIPTSLWTSGPSPATGTTSITCPAPQLRSGLRSAAAARTGCRNVMFNAHCWSA